MSLTPGTYLGPHEILAAIGAGGMGEVCGSVWTPDGRRLAFASDRGRRLAPIGK